MRAYFFILFICPVVLFAQNQPAQPANGATDCPTFGKKNISSKAGLFQYMRTHKPQRTPDPREQQAVYKSSALPNLQEAAEARQAAEKQQERNNERALAKAQRQRKNKPVITEEPVASPEIAEVTPAKQPSTREVQPEKEKTVSPSILEAKADKEESASTEDSMDAAKEKRDKKVKKAAFKSKIQHIFKRTNKPTSRKHIEKCPSF